jgi:iron complex transport system ATP-binding protein
MSLLNSLKQWSKNRKLTVMAVLHDLNMASLYCDRVLLLDEGKMVDLHSPHGLFLRQRVKRFYDIKDERNSEDGKSFSSTFSGRFH